MEYIANVEAKVIDENENEIIVSVKFYDYKKIAYENNIFYYIDENEDLIKIYKCNVCNSDRFKLKFSKNKEFSGRVHLFTENPNNNEMQTVIKKSDIRVLELKEALKVLNGNIEYHKNSNRDYEKEISKYMEYINDNNEVIREYEKDKEEIKSELKMLEYKMIALEEV